MYTLFRSTLCSLPHSLFFCSLLTAFLIYCYLLSFAVVFFSDSIFHHARRQFFNIKRDEDYVRKYNTNSEKYGWLVVGLVDSFYAAKATVLYYMKPADKRR